MKPYLAILCIAVSLLPNAVSAADRVALVVGNAAYQKVPKLLNTANDAAAVAEMFRNANFDVVEARSDLTNTEMRRALREFSSKSKDAEYSVVFYAGHGIEVDGMNYLVPTDAVLEQDNDAYDEAVPLERVLQAIEPAKKLRLVILDACRDNPFARSMKRAYATRSLGRGLAGVEPGRPNTLIAFAAKAGSTAEDGTGKNSPFTGAMLKYLTVPGVDLRKAFGQVRDDVMASTGNKQEPFVYGSLGGADVALVPRVAVSPQEIPKSNDARRDYELALQLSTKGGWTSFLAQYPTGFYADLARGQIKKLEAELQRSAAVERAEQAKADLARLNAENASRAERDKAAEEAKAATKARAEAEQRRKSERAKVDAAEKARTRIEQSRPANGNKCFAFNGNAYCQ